MLDMSTLPRLDADIVGFLSHAFALRGALDIPLVEGDEFEGESARIALDATRPSTAPVSMVSLPVSSAFGAFRIHFEMTVVDALCDVLLPGWADESEASLPPSWRVITAAHVVVGQTVLSDQDWAYGQLEAASPAEFGGPSWLPITLEWRGTAYRLFIEVITPPSAEFMASHMRRAARDLAGGLGLSVEVDLALSSLDIDMAAAAALSAGDLLLPPGSELLALRATASIQGASGWSGTLSADGAFTFLERIQKEVEMNTLGDLEYPTDSLDQNLNLNEGFEDDAEYQLTAEQSDEEFEAEEASEAGGGTEDITVAGIGLDDSELAELPVRLDIRLRSLSMPLSSFVDIASGTVLDTGADLAAPVDILGNGRVVGSGTLVQIGTRVGVQIDHWRGK